jgi:hypothetical protein
LLTVFDIDPEELETYKIKYTLKNRLLHQIERPGGISKSGGRDK